jgi:hypothetical protein
MAIVLVQSLPLIAGTRRIRARPLKRIRINSRIGTHQPGYQPRELLAAARKNSRVAACVVLSVRKKGW